MLRKLALKTVLIILVSGSFYACSKSQSEEDKKLEEQELEKVDETLKSDQERMDSMKKALKIED